MKNRGVKLKVNSHRVKNEIFSFVHWLLQGKQILNFAPFTSQA